MKPYANRGRELEKAILASRDIYAARGVGWVERIETYCRRTRGGLIEVKPPYDFVGHVLGIPVAFDAKETHGERWELDKRHDNQLESLRKFMTGPNAVAFYLVLFVNGGCYAITTQAIQGSGLRTFSETAIGAMIVRGEAAVVPVGASIPIGYGTAAVELHRSLAGRSE